MTPAARDRQKVGIPVLAATFAAWVALVAQAGGAGLMGSCCVPASLQDGFSSSSWHMLMVRNPPGLLALGWGLMVVAMMGPMMSGCIRHVVDRSLSRRRATGVLLFLAGYVGVWMAVGALMLPLALAIRLFAPTSFVPVAVAGLLALVWQCSPQKQRCLNRGHSHPRLAAFGAAAYLDTFRFGLTHGVWCVGSCGALMFVTELLPVGHLAAMVAVTIWLVAEKLNRTEPPRWRVRGVGKAIRLTYAQTRLVFSSASAIR